MDERRVRRQEDGVSIGGKNGGRRVEEQEKSEGMRGAGVGGRGDWKVVGDRLKEWVGQE